MSTYRLPPRTACCKSFIRKSSRAAHRIDHKTISNVSSRFTNKKKVFRDSVECSKCVQNQNRTWTRSRRTVGRKQNEILMRTSNQRETFDSRGSRGTERVRERVIGNDSLFVTREKLCGNWKLFTQTLKNRKLDLKQQ